MKPENITLTIDNFGGALTRKQFTEDINTGLAKYSTTFGIDTFSQPSNLLFMGQAVSIGGSVVTDMIVCGKVRLENSATYLYAVGHTGRVYKIQVNDPNTQNPNYNNPVLLSTLTNGQTFQQGGSMEFYNITGGSGIYIGCDQGVTSINFSGGAETVIGSAGAGWVQNVPRQVQLFAGKLYYTNGSNIATIDSSLTVTSYTQLSPGFPSGTQARDIDVTANGAYVVITVSEIPLVSILNTQPDANTISSGNSLIVYWNGTDTAATLASSIPSFAQTAYQTFANSEYSFGFDAYGADVSNPLTKVITLSTTQSPLPNGVFSTGNLVGWMAPESANGFLVGSLYFYGAFDEDFPNATFYRQARFSSTLSGGDVLKVPFATLVTNSTLGGATSGYANEIVGLGKMYFSTIEYNGTTTSYNLYSFNLVPNGTSAMQGVYETQTQVLGKKMKPTEVRVYMNPAVTNNDFKIDLIGIDGNVLSGASQEFSIGTKMAAGDTVVKYVPDTAPTAAIGLRVSNIGTVSPVIIKIEVDIAPFGR